MFDGIAEHKGHNRNFFFFFFFFFFLRNCLFFLLFLFNLILFNDLINKCNKVALTSFFFIILAELALHTVSLLGQLVFCTYALFGTLKNTKFYECGRVVKALDSGSDVRWFKPHRRSFFSGPDLLLIIIFMTFSPLNNS